MSPETTREREAASTADGPPPAVCVVYVTHRRAPQFGWFADSLASQLDEDPAEVLVVDGLYSPQRTTELTEAVRGRFALRHVPAKPTPWNGRHRLTRRDYFAVASARNTGIVCSAAPYLVFVDDSCAVTSGWWERVRQAAQHRYVVAGAYRTPASPEAGLAGAVDSRWRLGDDAGVVRVDGGQLFGCCFGAPRSLLLEVNGCDELCDPAGGEDYQLGLRLAMVGARILYDRRLLILKSAQRHHEPAPVRLDKRIDAEGYMARLARFGVDRRSTTGNHDQSHMVLDILYGTREPQSLGNCYRLAEVRAEDLGGLVDRFPREHWFDGQQLAEL